MFFCGGNHGNEIPSNDSPNYSWRQFQNMIKVVSNVFICFMFKGSDASFEFMNQLKIGECGHVIFGIIGISMSSLMINIG